MPFTSAHNLKTLLTDYTSGWAFKNDDANHPHLGTKTLSYCIPNAQMKSKYGNYFSGAVAKWGSGAMTLKYDGNSKNEVTELNLGVGTYAATRIYPKSNDPYHIQYVSIFIYPKEYDALNTTDKIRVLAHELGHAYGLGHTEVKGSLMYKAYPLGDAKAGDKNGLSVVTGTHTSHSGYTYSRIDAAYHKKRCGVCKGYYKEAHTFTGTGTNKRCSKCGSSYTNRVAPPLETE